MAIFSIVVPIYNIAQYLRQCLDSLVSQTFQDKEIILIDDGSTDSSREICDEYNKRYNCVKVIHQKNKGVSQARNVGLSLALGEWIVFVDADDWVDTDMLENMWGYILATNANLYRFGMCGVDEYGKKRKCRKLVTNHTIVSFASEEEKFNFYCQRHNLDKNVIQTACAGVYRRDIIKKHNITFIDRNEVIFEDTLFNYHYFLHTNKIVFLPDSPYYYRRHKASFCSTRDNNKGVLCSATLGEYAYQETIKQGLTYFEKNFHHHYFLFLNTLVWTIAARFTDYHLRQLLDVLWQNELHRECIKKIRQESKHFLKDTYKRVWFDENFGLKK